MDKTRAGYTEGVVSIIINTTLFGLKMWAGIVTGSLALTADAWHTLSDSLSSIFVIGGVKLSTRKPDRKHPFGHGRWEQITAVFIGVLLGIIAFSFLQDSIISMRDKESANFGVLAIAVTIVSIVMKEALAQYAFYIYRKTGNVSIKADGWHHRSDALSSVAVLIGIFFAGTYWWIDSLLGIVISLMLFYATFEIIRDAINQLLGEEPSPELISELNSLIKENYPDDIEPHHYHIHNYVAHRELTFHIKLDGALNIETGHQITTRLEEIIFEKLNIVSTVHVEPKNFFHKFD